MEQIPETPLNPGYSFSHATHRLAQTMEGVALLPTRRGPLYFAVVAYVVAVAAWLLTRDLEIDKGLKLAAWLFPVFAGTGPLVLYAVMSKLGSRMVFDTMKREVRLRGIRFRGGVTVPLSEVAAIQTCHGGLETTRESGSWQKYELNLVRRQGDRMDRICLLCHGKGDLIREQGRRIADRIGVKFLDSTSGRG